MNGTIPSWRKKAFDAGGKDNREILLSNMSSSLLSPAVLVNQIFALFKIFLVKKYLILQKTKHKLVLFEMKINRI